VETSQLTGAGWIIFGVSLVMAAVAFGYVLMSPSKTRVAAWASHYGLTLTEPNQSVVAAYLRKTRLLQLVFTTLGWVASPLYIGLLGRPSPLGDSWVALAIGGYLVGTVAAEVTYLSRRRAPASVRTAALSPRTPSNYVPAATIWAIRLLPIAMVILAAFYAVIPKDPQRGVDPSILFLAVSAIVVVAFAMVIDRLLWAVVARPQQATTEDLLAADDAIRASSIHALSAAVLAVILLSIGWALFSVGTVTSIAQVSQVLPWFGVICDVSALVVWIWVGHLTTWRVRREASLVAGK
jgi:hypothetical protein